VASRVRNASAALVFLVCLVALTSAFNLPNRSADPSSRLARLHTAAKSAQKRTALTIADRVAYQRAIEEVYWRHRIWPKERPDPKPSLDQVMPPSGKKLSKAKLVSYSGRRIHSISRGRSINISRAIYSGTLKGAGREIKEYANERYSWDKVAAITRSVYLALIER
jgi:hypothetical protein